MSDDSIIKVWGEGHNKLWSYGEYLDAPEDYIEVPTGDTFRTRRIKAAATNERPVFIRMEKTGRRGYSKPVGLLAPPDVVEVVRQAEEKNTDARANASRRTQEDKQEMIMARMQKLYPSMPHEDAMCIVAHAWQVGSNRGVHDSPRGVLADKIW